MDTLKKFWPFSFGTVEVKDLVIRAIVYVVVATVFAILIGVLQKIEVVKIIFTIIGALANIYATAGLVFLFLSHFKVIK